MALLGENIDRELKDEAERLVKSFLGEGETLIYEALSDLKEDATYGRRWLFVTNRRVVVATPGGGIEEVDLREIKGATVNDYTGNGNLELETGSGSRELVRFSRSCTEQFRKAMIVVNELVSERELIEKEGAAQMLLANERRKRTTVRWLLGYLRPHWPFAVLGMLLSLSVTGLSLVPPYLMRTLVDEVIEKRNYNLLPVLTLTLVSIYAINTLTSIAQSYTLSYLAQKVVFSMRSQVYEHLQMLSMGFYDRISSGRVLSRVTDDVGRVNWFLVWGIPNLVINSLQIIGIGMILFTLNLGLAVFALLPVPMIVIGIPLFRKKARRVYHKAWRRWADMSSLLVDTIPGAIVVKSFSQEKSEVKRLVERMTMVVKSNLETTRLNLSFFPMLGFTASVGAAIVWYVGGGQVLSGSLTLGTLWMFVSYMWMFYGPIQSLTNLVQPLQEAITSGERVLEIVELQPDIKDAEDAVSFEFKGSIEFRNVSFGYQPYIPVVKNITLSIKAGETIGIVGPSGGGKTTLTKLLLRFYDPSEGSILIDGVDIRKIKVQALRRQVGVVQQDPFLFYGSIAFNIGYGKSDSTPEEIIAAAKAANAHDFIMGSYAGYDSHVGERGSRISGGERQRIAIARAILNDPKILVMDEATSSVDTLTERQIQKAL
ncbi:MAG: ABC transporter ATP-binding protein, partial [Candidatus Brockarchaeota archaeon]|nr:ABC transporter ATP-binding protein [Candidatus Brockarchaeota archaeon]